MNAISITGAAPGKLSSIYYDSRQVRRGATFVAIRGNSVDGHDYIAAAIRKGAATVIAERRPDIKLPGKVTFILVEDTRDALARLADYYYDSPSRAMRVVGITGTNGKTTVSYILRSMLEAAGRRCARIGTTGYDLLGDVEEASVTTPESLDLQRMMRTAADRGSDYLTLEVSSHALTQSRVDYVRFRTAVFTNLTQDHLDYHHDMEGYFAAKARLFSEHEPENAVVNMDDPYAKRLITMTGANIVTYGQDSYDDIVAEDVNVGVDGLTMTLKTLKESVRLRSPMTGMHNVYNILAAAGAAYCDGMNAGQMVMGAGALDSVPGRFQRVEGDHPFTVIVDYAHTPDALANALETAGSLAKGRVITVFGCGGDRDRTKRPLMGRAAWKMSDKIVVTSDNPRTENPEAIIDDILEGVSEADNPQGEMKVIPDRREAIRAAVRMAQEGDLVLIAGKGHETYQIIGAIKSHFDDREEAAAAIREIYGKV